MATFPHLANGRNLKTQPDARCLQHLSPGQAPAPGHEVPHDDEVLWLLSLWTGGSGIKFIAAPTAAVGTA